MSKDETCTTYTSHEKTKKYWIAGIEISKNENTKLSQMQLLLYYYYYTQFPNILCFFQTHLIKFTDQQK